MKVSRTAVTALIVVTVLALLTTQSSGVVATNVLSGVTFIPDMYDIMEGDILLLTMTISTSDGFPLSVGCVGGSGCDTGSQFVINYVPLSANATFDDFEPISATVQVEAGTAPGDVITVTDFYSNDDPDGDDETFVFVINGFAQISQAVVVVRDDDNSPTIVLNQDSYVVNEGGTVTVCAELNNLISIGGTTVAEITSNFVLTPETSSGAGVDYVDPSLAELSIVFPVGSVDGATDCVDISAVDDDLVECDESFTVSLEPPTSSGTATLGSPSSAPVTIEDDDTVSVELIIPCSTTMQDSVITEEPNGGSDVCVCVRLTRDSNQQGRLEKTVTAIVNTNAGNAEAYADYFPIRNRPIQFTPGHENRVICLQLTIFDDYFCEDDESFYISLSTVIDVDSVVLVPNRSQITIIIADDNSQPCNVPVNGGCPMTRLCLPIGQSRMCSNCSDGLVRDPINPGGECIETAIEFDDGFPLVLGKTFTVKFFINPDVEFGSAMCRISGQQDTDCSTGIVQFTDVIPRHCPYTVTIKLDNVNNSTTTSIKRKTKVYVVNDVCVVNLAGEGIVVEGNEVTVNFQETGNTSCNKYACRVNFRSVIDPCGDESRFVTILPSGENQITIWPACGSNECEEIIEVTFDIVVP